jgi:ketosteroid isomerase-like protein
MMRKSLRLVCFLAVATLGGSALAKGAKDLESLKAAQDKMNKAFESGDMTAARALIADEVWGVWDYDMAGRPAAWAKTDDLMAAMTQMMDAMKAMGATWTFKVTALDCRIGGDLGICLQEGDATMNIPNMPPMTMAMRGTDVWQKKGKAGWKAVHHHASLAKAPDMPGQFMAANAKTAKWMDMPGRPEAKVMPLWMNPADQSMAALMKVGKEGMKQAKHMHPFPFAGVVMEGSITTTAADGKDTKFGPGTVFYRAAKEVHSTSIEPGSVLFMVATGPMQDIFVDDAGNPLPPKEAAPAPATPAPAPAPAPEKK